MPNARAGLIYGYRAYGPYEPQHGHRFNHHKLLLDPYARRIAGELRPSDALYGYRVNSPRADLSFDRRDSAPGMLKAVVTDDSFNWADDRPPNVPWSDTVIYEAHVRGLSMLRQDLQAQRARHLRRPGRPALHRPHAAARRHRGRADADPRLRAGPQPAAEGPAQLLGLQHHRLLRPRAALPVGQHARRDAHRRPPPARRRHRADPRRRLQPYRRGQRAGADAVVPRPRQCQLLPPGRRQSAPLRQRHRHRQHGEPVARRASCRW